MTVFLNGHSEGLPACHQQLFDRVDLTSVSPPPIPDKDREIKMKIKIVERNMMG